MLSPFIAEHREALLATAANRLRQQRPAPPAVEAVRGLNLPMLIESILVELRAHEKEGAESAPRVAGGAHISGAQVRFDIDELVSQYESVCHSVNEIGKQLGVMISLADQQLLNTSLDDCIARTVLEWEHEKQKSRGANEIERLGFVVHEMRNALHAGVISFQAIRSGRVAVQGATAKVVDRSHARLEALIENLLTQVRLDAGLQEKQALLVVQKLVEESLSLVAAEAATKEIEISVEADSSLEIDGDHDLLVTVLTNLLQNAVKFARHEGSVSVKTHATSQGHAVIEIESGCDELAADTVERLFTPFTQARSDRSGLGLGLVIARQVIDAHGGTIDVKTLPGHGCVFVVEIPLRRAP